MERRVGQQDGFGVGRVVGPCVIDDPVAANAADLHAGDDAERAPAHRLHATIGQEPLEQRRDVVRIGGGDRDAAQAQCAAGRCKRERRRCGGTPTTSSTSRACCFAPSSPKTKDPLVQAHMAAETPAERNCSAPSRSRQAAPVSRSASTRCASSPIDVCTTTASNGGVVSAAIRG